MSIRLLPCLLLLVPFCHAAFSDFFSPLDAEISALPYRMKGEWHNSGGVKSLGRKNGAAELYKSSYDYLELVRFDVRIYDGSSSDLESENLGISRFWRIYLGYSEKNQMSSITFPGYGAVDRRKGKLIAVHKDTPLREAYQLIKPRDMTFERFPNMTAYSRNHRR